MSKKDEENLIRAFMSGFQKWQKKEGKPVMPDETVEEIVQEFLRGKSDKEKAQGQSRGTGLISQENVIMDNQLAAAKIVEECYTTGDFEKLL